MIYTELTRKAMEIAYRAHHGQVDRGGTPYIFHPFHVAEEMDDEITACAALLHDVVEDSQTTLEDLARAGFPGAVLDAVELLTRPAGKAYDAYIRRLAPNPVARRVKLADLRHNSDKSRLSHLTGRDLARLERYREAYAYLADIESGAAGSL